MTKKCSGCGVLLQNDNIDKEGYVDDLNKDICERCFKLKYYGEYKEVTLDNKDYQNILNSIPKDSLVVYLTSLLSLNLDIINNFNNVIIVLTKKDLLPKSVKDYKLIDYVSKRVNNYLDIEVISSVKNYNLDSLMNKIKKYSNNKEVYIAGAIVIKYKNRANIYISGYDKKYVSYNPNYFLHYMICEQYKYEFDFIDLNGISGDFSIDHPYYGLNKFKMGFNPKLYEFIGEYDLIVNPGSYKSLMNSVKMFNKLNDK